MMRIGSGFDAHKFAAGRKLILGGVTIPHDKGMEAHSDGDVVLHALCDALLGAAALGDIGQHFPDTSADYKDADSRELLRHVYALLKEKNLTLGNADITIIAQAPKLAPHINTMCNHIAADLETEISNINVKATTTEGMGFTGRGEGIAVQAVV
ncbi:MAG: 2-C-methyl-D-erythritol 2,4-cyclodiphosphate synthase, partial [Gammaproteobacteria bacterium]|nr:2-C-methyl-D-erythritol 2,4-cyclodiphosphate synthase [Gammaproteobacteria bacterium]